ncbi:MAG: hypothetical protein ACYTGH_12625, partial [Planctomycetota bacterium]
MTDHNQSKLPESLSPLLRAALRRYLFAERFWQGLGNLSQLALAAVGFLALACLFDRFVDVAGVWRAPLPWIAGVIALVLVLRLLGRLLGRKDYDRAAHALDLAAEDPRGRLRSSLDFSGKPEADGFFMAETLAQTQALWARSIPSPAAARSRGLRLLGGALVLLLLCGGAAQIPELRAQLLLKRFLNPLGNHMRPTATWFEVVDAPPAVMNSGDALELRAALRGRAVEAPAPVVFLRQPDGSTQIRQLAQDEDGLWGIRLASVEADLSF